MEEMGTVIVDILERAGARFLRHSEPDLYRAYLLNIGGADTVRRYDRTTTYWDRGHYLRGNLFYDLAKATMCRLAFDMAQELKPHAVTSLALSPGWMRTEFVLAGHHADESNWQQQPALARTESPRYLGRAWKIVIDRQAAGEPAT